MYFTKASKTRPFPNRMDDTITRGTYILHHLFSKEKENNKGDLQYVQTIFWSFHDNRQYAVGVRERVQKQFI